MGFQRTGRRGCVAGRRQVFAAVFLLAANTHAQNAAPGGTGARVSQAPMQTAVEFTDEAGRIVRVPQPVRRIVSLAPSLTETLFALGAGNLLAGDTDYCDYPPEALSKPKVGGAINPSIEQIVALRPDLVLATKSLNRRETVAALDRLGIPTYVTDPHTVEAMIASTARLADVAGVHGAGAALAASLRERLAALQSRLNGEPARSVLFVVWTDPLISVGRDTFIADALRWAGARSVVESPQDWPQISLEGALRLQPEFLVFSGEHSEAEQRNLEALAQLPGWRDLDAAHEGRFAVVSEAFIRPAPRLLYAIEQLARQLHPQAFLSPPPPEQKPADAPAKPGLAGQTGSLGAPRFLEGRAACAR